MKLPTIRGEKMNTYKCQRGPIRVHGLYSTLKKRKEEKIIGCCIGYKASKRSDVGNDPRLWFGSASASLFFFSLPLPSFFFLSKLSEPPKPFPCMAIYRKIHFWGRGSSPHWLLHPEGITSLRRAGCLRLKVSHGPGKPDASLGKLGPRKFQKMTILPHLGGFCFQNWQTTIKTMHDPLALGYYGRPYRTIVEGLIWGSE